MKGSSALRAGSVVGAVLGLAACTSLLGVSDIVGADGGRGARDGEAEREAASHHDGSPGAHDGTVGSSTGDAAVEAGTDGSRHDADADVDAAATCGSGDIVCDGACVSPQTSTSNCGACGRTCGGTCAAGRCTVSIYAEGHPFGLLLGDGHVYWTDDKAGLVLAATTSGETVTTLASGQTDPGNLSVGPTFGAQTGPVTTLYWGSATGTSLSYLAVNGGATSGLVEHITGQNKPVGVAGNASGVFWGNDEPDASILLEPLGSPPVTPQVIASRQDEPIALAINSTEVFWGTFAGGTIVKALASGAGNITTIASGQASPVGIALDGMRAYWVNKMSGSVVAAHLDGGALVTLATGQTAATAVTVDSTSVYWLAQGITGGTGSSFGLVIKMALDGGVVTTLAVGQRTPTNIAVDDASVYWTDNGVDDAGGAVMMVTPK